MIKNELPIKYEKNCLSDPHDENGIPLESIPLTPGYRQMSHLLSSSEVPTQVAKALMELPKVFPQTLNSFDFYPHNNHQIKDLGELKESPSSSKQHKKHTQKTFKVQLSQDIDNYKGNISDIDELVHFIVGKNVDNKKNKKCHPSTITTTDIPSNGEKNKKRVKDRKQKSTIPFTATEEEKEGNIVIKKDNLNQETLKLEVHSVCECKDYPFKGMENSSAKTECKLSDNHQGGTIRVYDEEKLAILFPDSDEMRKLNICSNKSTVISSNIINLKCPENNKISTRKDKQADLSPTDSNEVSEGHKKQEKKKWSEGEVGKADKTDKTKSGVNQNLRQKNLKNFKSKSAISSDLVSSDSLTKPITPTSQFGDNGIGDSTSPFTVNSDIMDNTFIFTDIDDFHPVPQEDEFQVVGKKKKKVKDSNSLIGSKRVLQSAHIGSKEKHVIASRGKKSFHKQIPVTAIPIVADTDMKRDLSPSAFPALGKASSKWRKSLPDGRRNSTEERSRTEKSVMNRIRYQGKTEGFPHLTTNEHYEACMVLSGVGDALGFKNGQWEFCYSGRQIHDELEDLGGIESISVALPDWRLSDDTIMHLATAEALIVCVDIADKENLYRSLASHYIDCMKDMKGRAPGETCLTSCRELRSQKGYTIPFNERGGGCGAAMRAMCIGLRFPRHQDLEDLIAVSVEAGRMTHHHPTGYLGSLAAALFTSYAIQGRLIREWGKGLMDCLPKVLKYVQSQGRNVEENERAWDYFKNKWTKYLEERCILEGKSDPVFPDKYGIEERDDIYSSWSFAGWAGSSGHDAPMIAYDALLGAGNNWRELCHRAMFHGGDSDSTGVMAGAWFGSMYGYQGVPWVNYKNLEYLGRLKEAGARLHILQLEKQLKEEEMIAKEKEMMMAKNKDKEISLRKLEKMRTQHISHLKNDGENTYQHKFQVDASLTECLEKYHNMKVGSLNTECSVCVSGWIHEKGEPKDGKVIFDLRAEFVKISIVAIADHYSSGEELKKFIETVQPGDIVGVRGHPGRADNGDIYIVPQEVVTLAPCVHQMPRTDFGDKVPPVGEAVERRDDSSTERNDDGKEKMQGGFSKKVRVE